MKRIMLIVAVVVTCTLAMTVHVPSGERVAAPDSPDLSIIVTGDAEDIYGEGTECILVTYDFWHGYAEIPSEIRFLDYEMGFELTTQRSIEILGEGPAQTWKLLYDDGTISEGTLFDLVLNGEYLGEYILIACPSLDA